MKDTKICSIGGMKGGVGKSTVTSLVANYIHLNTEFSVCVIDTDDFQETLNDLRNADLKTDVHKNSLYDLIPINSSDLENVIKTLIGNYDFIFVDAPGNLLQEGVIQTYSIVDYLFVPTGLSSADLNGTVRFMDFYNSQIKPLRTENNLKSNVYCFLCKVHKNVKEFKEFNNLRENLPFLFLDNYIPYSYTAFQRDASTVDAYKNYKGEKEYDIFCKELINLTQN